MKGGSNIIFPVWRDDERSSSAYQDGVHIGFHAPNDVDRYLRLLALSQGKTVQGLLFDLAIQAVQGHTLQDMHEELANRAVLVRHRRTINRVKAPVSVPEYLQEVRNALINRKVWPKDREAIVKRIRNNMKNKECIYCGADIKAGALACNVCTSKLRDIVSKLKSNIAQHQIEALESLEKMGRGD